MINERSITLGKQPAETDKMPVIGAVLLILTAVVGILLFVSSEASFDSYPFLFLTPWIAVLALVLAIPVLLTIFRKDQRFDNPLLIATGTYFFPAFVVGGLSVSIGWSDPYVIQQVQDITTALPFTIFIIILGYAGLSLGYYLPIGKFFGSRIGSFLPDGFGRSDELRPYIIGGLVLVGIGILASINAAVVGIIGFQKGDSIGIFDGIIFLSTFMLTEGSFILWYCVFRKQDRGPREWIIVGLLLSIVVGYALFSGSRGSLLTSMISVFLAYLLAGNRFTVRLAITIFTIFFFAVVLGMIYGTTFRQTKGTEARVSLDVYVDSIGRTFDEISTRDNFATLELGLGTLAQRLDTVSSLAVVVSTYEQLAPYEEGYGLDNNIWKDTSTFFVPRVFWPDKPVASDARRYSDLYFNYADSSFAITPMGDLIRNYGVIGVFLGMFILGFILRSIYSSLIENRPSVVWKATLYFMLMTAVSYEGFYGAIIPMLFKTGFTAMVGIIIVEIVAKRFSQTTQESSLVIRR